MAVTASSTAVTTIGNGAFCTCSELFPRQFCHAPRSARRARAMSAREGMRRAGQLARAPGVRRRRRRLGYRRARGHGAAAPGRHDGYFVQHSSLAGPGQ
jgi:hypothetical protein